MGKRKVVSMVAGFLILALVTVGGVACGSPKLTALSNPSAGGIVTPAVGTYEKGVAVSVRAIPASGYRFDHWEGAASGESPTVPLVMDGNKKLIAYFTKVFTLSASPSPSSGGNVSPSGGTTYDAGKQATLIATPAQCYKFNGWSGDASGISDHLTLTMDSAKSVIASFVKITYTLQAQVDASGGGTVSPSDVTLEACNQITVTATPANGYRFNHWGGDASGTSNPLNIIMSANKTITSYFTKVYTLTISASPNSSGSVSPGCGLCDAGANNPLTAATAVFPYAFDHWSGTDGDNTNPTTVTMSADKSVTAYFKQLSPGPKQTKSDQLSGPAKIADFQLKAGQWVQGEISGNPFDLNSQIVDSNNNVVKDLGRNLYSPFQFQAPSTGTYYFVISDIHSILFNRYTLTYTIYS
ncbi:MAG: InlB B-repeat-containing protein [Dehalococcoidia bacterium]|nr:InlB B-repeat-containing protein [Dehalococcoidia bacterium]